MGESLVICECMITKEELKERQEKGEKIETKECIYRKATQAGSSK
jgi:hypothetical protein